jgi:hypothetical protein
MPAADELLIRDVDARRASNHSVCRRQAVDWVAQFPCRQAQERFPGSRCRESEILGIEVGWSRLTSGGRALVWGDGCIALNQLYARDRHAQFFRDQLSLCGKYALSEIALSRVSRDCTVRTDREPGV